MSYLQYFMDEHKPLCKPKIVAVEEDWNFLCMIFPEPGFRSYFPGFIISQLAKELKQNGINTYFDRQSRPELASLTGLLPHLVLVRNESFADDGRGTRSPHETSASGPRESADNEGTLIGWQSSEEREKSAEETGFEIVRLVTVEKFPFAPEDIKRALSA